MFLFWFQSIEWKSTRNQWKHSGTRAIPPCSRRWHSSSRKFLPAARRWSDHSVRTHAATHGCDHRWTKKALRWIKLSEVAERLAKFTQKGLQSTQSTQKSTNPPNGNITMTPYPDGNITQNHGRKFPYSTAVLWCIFIRKLKINGAPGTDNINQPFYLANLDSDLQKTQWLQYIYCKNISEDAPMINRLSLSHS